MRPMLRARSWMADRLDRYSRVGSRRERTRQRPIRRHETGRGLILRRAFGRLGLSQALRPAQRPLTVRPGSRRMLLSPSRSRASRRRHRRPSRLLRRPLQAAQDAVGRVVRRRSQSTTTASRLPFETGRSSSVVRVCGFGGGTSTAWRLWATTCWVRPGGVIRLLLT